MSQRTVAKNLVTARVEVEHASSVREELTNDLRLIKARCLHEESVSIEKGKLSP